MSTSLATLARDKELLLARSALCRLRLRNQAAGLRDSLRWPQVAFAAATSPGAGRVLLGIALSVPVLARTARFAVTALRIAFLAKLAFSLVGHGRRLAGKAPRAGSARQTDARADLR